VAAPVAAWLARHIPPRMLGSLVGGLIVVTNVRTLLHLEGVSAPLAVEIITLVAVGLVWVAAVGWSARAHRAERAAAAATAVPVPASLPAVRR